MKEIKLREIHCPFCMSELTLCKQTKKIGYFMLRCFNCESKLFLLDPCEKELENNWQNVQDIYGETAKEALALAPEPQKETKINLFCPFCHSAIRTKKCFSKKGKISIHWLCKSGCGRGFISPQGFQSFIKICDLTHH